VGLQPVCIALRGHQLELLDELGLHCALARFLQCKAACNNCEWLLRLFATLLPRARRVFLATVFTACSTPSPQLSHPTGDPQPVTPNR
jgi:hypothetical protein